MAHQKTAVFRRWRFWLRGWWSNRKGVALTYATTDPVRGPKGGNSLRYDVLLQGEAIITLDNEHNSDKDITHALRSADSEVTILNVYYIIRTGTSKERRIALDSLVGT